MESISEARTRSVYEKNLMRELSIIRIPLLVHWKPKSGPSYGC